MAYQELGFSLTDVAKATGAVATDPCLGQVTALVLELHAAEQKSAGVSEPSAPSVGIGLCHAVKPLRAAAWASKNRWAVPVGAVAIVGGLVFLGYTLGKRRRR